LRPGFFCFLLFIFACSIDTDSDTPRSENPELDTFAKCLTERGYEMAGTESCSHCRAQKARFQDSFRFIRYHDCKADTSWCRDKGIRAYPTWVSPDGKLHVGEKELSELSALSGCDIDRNL